MKREKADNVRKIQRMSKTLKWITTALMVLLPVLDAGYWILGGFSFMPVIGIDFIPWLGEAVVPPIGELAPIIRFFGFLTTLIPVGLAIIALGALRKLFEHYEKIEIFSESAAKCIRLFGWMLLIGQLSYPFYCALMSLTLTISNPPGQRMITVSFGLTQMGLTILASCILLISWITEEGKKLKEECEATI